MKTQLSYNEAFPLATRIKEALSPGCERIEIAGSIRRRKEAIGDIEIVCIPLYSSPQMTLFPGDSDRPKVSLLNNRLDELLARGNHLLPGGFKRGNKNGEKYKTFTLTHNYQDIGIDLFITSPAQWGLIFAIRTGPSEFSKALVTQRNKGGWLPSDCKVTGGYIINPDGLKVPTPEEDDLFALLGMEIIPPPERSDYCNANWIPF